MTTIQYQSWGRYYKIRQRSMRLSWRHETIPLPPGGGDSILPYGNGRSYGDSCLNDDGWILDCRGMDRFIAFDSEQGVLRCEAGVLLSEILALIVPSGWFLPVTPGTQFITIGGAIANDVHGKNHHRSGTFGRHVLRFELLRSDKTRLECSPKQNLDLYRATIGGLGLTGVVTWAEIQLKPIESSFIDQEVIRFHCLEEFFDLSAESDQHFEHTVAWIDCLSRGPSLGRGLFMRGNHANRDTRRHFRHKSLQITFPVDPPFSLINNLTLHAFNTLYYHKQRSNRSTTIVPYEPFFYPLDAILDWNRAYGSKGFLQYQCVIPPDHARDSMREILDRIAASGTGSFLAILKVFGDSVSPGLLSFPRPGITLALDFPNRGQKTLDLFKALDQITLDSGGAIYPAKNGSVSAACFRAAFPQWEAFRAYIDPRFSSSFWRKIEEHAT